MSAQATITHFRLLGHGPSVQRKSMTKPDNAPTTVETMMIQAFTIRSLTQLSADTQRYP